MGNQPMRYRVTLHDDGRGEQWFDDRDKAIAYYRENHWGFSGGVYDTQATSKYKWIM